MKGGKYTKFLAKIQVSGRIFRIRDIQRNVLPKFKEICMETPCWCPPGWAPTRRTETNKNIYYRVLVQKPEFILEELINIKLILSLIHELFRSQNSPKDVTFWKDNSPGRHVNATSHKSLEIQTYSITKPRTLLKRKFVWKLVFSCSNTLWK